MEPPIEILQGDIGLFLNSWLVQLVQSHESATELFHMT